MPTVADYRKGVSQYRPFTTSKLTTELQLLHLTADLNLPRLTYEPMFRRHMINWLQGPTLDAAYFALEALQLCGGIKGGALDQRTKRTVLAYLNACYVPSKGGFSTTPYGIPESLYGTISAIGVLKSLADVRCNKRLAETKQTLSDSQLLSENDFYTIEKGVDGLLRSHIGSGSNGVFFDIVTWPHGSIMGCSMACSILYNIGKEDRFYELVHDENTLRDFLRRCLRKVKKMDTSWAGFAPHPDDPTPGLSVTYHVLRLLERLNHWDGKEDKVRMLELDLKEVHRFIDMCWTGSGFSPTIGDSPSLAATYYEIRCIDFEVLSYSSEQKQHIMERIDDFVGSCKSQDFPGLYGITPGFSPDVAATRYAAQVGKIVGEAIRNPVNSAHTATAIKEFWAMDGGFYAFPVKLLKRTAHISRTSRLLVACLKPVVGYMEPAVKSFLLLRKVIRSLRARA